VETKTQKPQNQKYYENCPKHVDLLTSIPVEQFIYLGLPAGAKDFPHSIQDDLDRGVINPQNGHILGDAKPRPAGVSDRNSLETDARIAENRVRMRSRNGPAVSLILTGFDDDTRLLQQSVQDCSPRKRTRTASFPRRLPDYEWTSR
jgi:hypothetical protein